MALFGIFGGSKPEPGKSPVTKKWIGSVKAEWTKANAHSDFCVYNLFIDTEGKRTMEGNGINWATHPLYLTRVYPWINGGPDALLVGILESKDDSYWGPAPSPLKARKAAKVKAKK